MRRAPRALQSMSLSALWRIAAAVAVTLLCVAPGAALADDAALLELSTEGQISATTREAFVAAAEAALAAGQTPQLRSLAEATARLQTVAPEVAGCLDPACLQRAAQALEVPVGYEVRIGEAFDSYTIDIVAWDLASGTQLATAQQSCDICTPEEAYASLAVAAAAVTTGWTPPATATPEPVAPVAPVKAATDTVRVAVYADPSDARIVIDGAEVGQGKFVGTLVPGTHTVEIARSGYTTAIKEVELEPGDGTLHLAVDLRPTAQAMPRTAGRTGGFVDDFDREVAAWSLTGGGALVAIAGGVLLGLDGETTCEGGEPTSCPEVFETTAAGGVLLGLGVAALSSGVILFLWDELAGHPSEAPAARADAEPTLETISVAPLGDAQRSAVEGGVLLFGGHF